MKPTKLLLMFAAMVLTISACTEKQEQQAPMLRLTAFGKVLEDDTQLNLLFDHRGDSHTIRVDANTLWEAFSDAPWLLVIPAEGEEGMSGLCVQAEPNLNFESRAGKVTVSLKDYPLSREIVVCQESDSPYIKLSQAEISFEAKGGQIPIEIESNCAWYLLCDAFWIDLSTKSGDRGVCRLTISVKENQTIEEKSCKIEFKTDESVTASLSITQAVDMSGWYIDEYGKNRGRGIMIAGTMWAPVNCGYLESIDGEPAHPYGKYYQWGRKVGFGYNDNGSHVDADVPTVVRGPITSPDEADDKAFYNNSANWLSSKVNDLWNAGTEEAPIKTKYDPCPSGWRVPTWTETLPMIMKNVREEHGGVMGRWCSGDEAYEEGVPAIFIPEIGQIAYGSNSTDFGKAGYYWTSTVNDADLAIQLYSGNWINKNDWTDRRANAYPIRCVAE